MTAEPLSLRPRDSFLLASFCLALFGFNMFSGRPLTMHEARLPQLAREMYAGADWLLPTSGGRPWLERPPLPHWCILAADLAFESNDRVWIVRLPSAVAGAITVLLTAWMAARLLGRTIGIVSGLVLATMYEFYVYASLAEDDIFLAALVAAAMALFVHIGFAEIAGHTAKPIRFLGRREWFVLLLFIVAGLTSLVKGPLVGLTQIVAAIGCFLLLARDSRAKAQLIWLWGWLVCLAITLAWPLWAYHRYPDVWDNWLYDYAGRGPGAHAYDRPVWYYPITLLWTVSPWAPALVVGLVHAGRAAFNKRAIPQQFVCAWAVAVLILLSIPHRKHHHYLVPSLAPWAMLAAIGLERIARLLLDGHIPPRLRGVGVGFLCVGLPVAVLIWIQRGKIPGPAWTFAALILLWLTGVVVFCTGWSARRGKVMLASIVGGLCIIYCWGQTIADRRSSDTAAAMAFLRRVAQAVPTDKPLMINSDMGLNFFRIQFYLRGDAVLLHNLSFLRDERIVAPEVYVVTRPADQARLTSMGQYEEMVRTKGLMAAGSEFALFRLHFDPAMQRYPAPKEITVMQAIQRAPGPYCGPWNDSSSR